MSDLFKLYQSHQGFDVVEEYEKFYKNLEIRCNNLIVCGEKLPFYIRGIKPHEFLNQDKLVMESSFRLGINYVFDGSVIIVNNITPTYYNMTRIIKESGND